MQIDSFFPSYHCFVFFGKCSCCCKKEGRCPILLLWGSHQLRMCLSLYSRDMFENLSVFSKSIMHIQRVEYYTQYITKLTDAHHANTRIVNTLRRYSTLSSSQHLILGCSVWRNVTQSLHDVSSVNFFGRLAFWP